MLDQTASARADDWQAVRLVRLRQMATDLRTAARRRPPPTANVLRQLAADLERRANSMEELLRMEEVISRPV